MSTKTTNFMHYFFNFSAYVIGYPFMIAVGVFPILLLTMAFIGTESLLDVVVFYGVIAVFSFAFLLLLSVLKIAKRDFFHRRGVSSLKEYYSLYLSKNVRAEKSRLQAEKKAKAISQSKFLNSLSPAKSLTPSLPYLTPLPFKPLSTKNSYSNIKLFLSAGLSSLSVIVILTCSFLLIFNHQLSFLWAVLFFQGMLLSCIASSKSVGTPFNTTQKTHLHPIKRLLFGDRTNEVDFKIFSLFLGVMLIILSLLLFAVQEFTAH